MVIKLHNRYTDLIVEIAGETKNVVKVAKSWMKNEIRNGAIPDELYFMNDVPFPIDEYLMDTTDDYFYNELDVLK